METATHSACQHNRASSIHTHTAQCTQTPLQPEQSEPLSRNESELAFLCGGKDSK